MSCPKMNDPFVRRVSTFALMGAVALSLSACNSARSALGLEKTPPDEFAVVTKAPLIVPPDYSLRPPKPGAPRPQELQPSASARAALLGQPVEGEEVNITQGETALLLSTGADRQDPNIRAVLNEESGRLREKDQSFTDEVLFSNGGGAGSGTLDIPVTEEDMIDEGEDETEDATIEKKEGGGFFSRVRGIF